MPKSNADQRVRPLQANLAKLYAAIGPMDELDTVDDAVARVAQLRQERDAREKFVMASLGIEWDKDAKYTLITENGPEEAGDTFEEAIGSYVEFSNKIDEARERAEKALREILPFVERRRVNLKPCVKCDHESCELVRRALASLKSSEGAK